MAHRELRALTLSFLGLCMLGLPLLSAQAEEKSVQIALAQTPFVLRDGREAEANVVRVAFPPNSSGIRDETRSQLQDLLGQVDSACVLSVQVVGTASEFETAPRVAVDTHLLARQRADNVASLALATGMPAAALASIWSVNDERSQPKTAVWLFLDKSTPDCAAEPPYLVEKPLAVEPPPTVAVAVDHDPTTPLPVAAPTRSDPDDLPKMNPENSSTDTPPATTLNLSFANNSSYLSDRDTSRLQQFARRLGPACKIRVAATVAGTGADAHYAEWLAERRLDRVGRLLHDNATGGITAETELLRNDPRRLVILSLPDPLDCAERRPSNTFAARQ